MVVPGQDPGPLSPKPPLLTYPVPPATAGRVCLTSVSITISDRECKGCNGSHPPSNSDDPKNGKESEVPILLFHLEIYQTCISKIFDDSFQTTLKFDAFIPEYQFTA